MGDHGQEQSVAARLLALPEEQRQRAAEFNAIHHSGNGRGTWRFAFDDGSVLVWGPGNEWHVEALAKLAQKGAA